MSKLNKKTLLRILNWIVLIVWAVFIFSNSADNGTTSGGKSDVIANYVIDAVYPDYENMDAEKKESLHSDVVFIVRKGAHITEFAVLGVLTSLLISQYTEKRRIWYPASIVCSVIYASTDEFHQLFVPGRGGQVRDVLIDSIGILVGCSAVLLIITLVKRRAAKLQRKAS